MTVNIKELEDALKAIELYSAFVDYSIIIKAAKAYVTQQWRPIESAPRDGRRILVTAHDEKNERIYPYIAFFRQDQDAWKSDDDYWIDFEHLTHWQPLPIPPEREGV